MKATCTARLSIRLSVFLSKRHGCCEKKLDQPREFHDSDEESALRCGANAHNSMSKQRKKLKDRRAFQKEGVLLKADSHRNHKRFFMLCFSVSESRCNDAIRNDLRSVAYEKSGIRIFDVRSIVSCTST
ncbi:hypothetical protein [Paraburkholderia hospita]|uniref:hypothetical protein n=1 Tax=Paraburkholderia hospita TaxID=169430 RepID=UPI0013F159CE|nr:hypothetical protein [Paraburkholderia hospita]